MTDEKKKAVQIALIIACFLLAAGITAWNLGLFSGRTSYQTGPRIVVCTNPQCGAQYEVSTDELRKMLMEANPAGMMPPGGPMAGPPAMFCKKCGEQTAYIAEKCEKCGTVFLPDYQASDYIEMNRCPSCGYNRYEEMSKNQD
ncbi:MAG: hypothetical protein ABIG61_01890 [Planctomycetota bacterium]